VPLLNRFYVGISLFLQFIFHFHDARRSQLLIKCFESVIDVGNIADRDDIGVLRDDSIAVCQFRLDRLRIDGHCLENRRDQITFILDVFFELYIIIRPAREGKELILVGKPETGGIRGIGVLVRRQTGRIGVDR